MKSVAMQPQPATDRAVPRTRRWVALVIGIVSLAAVAFAVPAAIHFLQGSLARVIEERGLEPDGLFYTETDEVAEAFNYLVNSALGEAPAGKAGVSSASR